MELDFVFERQHFNYISNRNAQIVERTHTLIADKKPKNTLVVINKINCIDSKAISCRYSNEYFSRDSSSFKKNPRSIINVSCTSEESKIIEYLYSIPHVTLSNNASWALGIVTGNNDRFCSNENGSSYARCFKNRARRNR